MGLSASTILLFVASTLLVSLTLNQIFLRFTTNLGTRTTGEVRFASTAKPSVGGFTFYIVFLLCFITINLIYPDLIFTSTKQTAGIFAATSLGFLLGFADDAYNTNPILKFSGQIACGVILVFTDMYIPLVSESMRGGFTINSFFTVIWVVGIMNSLNMLDNMDAITTSVSICILGCALYLLSINGYSDRFMSLMILGVMATLAGFLYFNWNPAKMYMGDTGSQFLGVFLAAVAIKMFWVYKDPDVSGFQLRQFVIPLLAFMMPIIDTTTVFIRRIARGQSPFKGGADHTTHHLAYLGLSVRMVGVLFIALSLVSILIIHFLVTIPGWNYLFTYIVVGYFLILFLGMQFLYDLGGKKQEKLMDETQEPQSH